MIIDEQYTLLRFKTRTTQRWLGSKIEYIFLSFSIKFSREVGENLGPRSWGPAWKKIT